MAPTIASNRDLVGLRPAFTRSEAQQLKSSRALLVIVVLGTLGALLTANPLITLLSVVIAAMLVRLLWRSGEPPVLLFGFGIQWVQVTTVLHYANFAHVSLGDVFGGPELEWAVTLGLLSLLALGLGVRAALVRTFTSVADDAELESRASSISTVFLIYLTAFVGLSLLRLVANRIPQISQLLIATMGIKWLLLFILAYMVFQQRRRQMLLWLAVALEFSAGLLTYFSGFRSVFFLVIVVMLATRQFWTLRRIILGIFLCVALVVTSIIWSTIKQDYREFLNQGTKTQAVLVPIPQRIDKLQDLLSELTEEGFFEGVGALITRASYVTYFALTIVNVPAHIPYENGELWLGAVKHVLMPRLFFPNKAPISDSERTSYYTGIQVAGEEQGTSISIGYMGESYIDLGPIGMFLPIFLIGVLYGAIYRFFVFGSRYRLIGFAAATAVLLFSASNCETSNIKLLGGVMTSAIVLAVFLLFAENHLAHLIRLRRAR